MNGSLNKNQRIGSMTFAQQEYFMQPAISPDLFFTDAYGFIEVRLMDERWVQGNTIFVSELPVSSKGHII